MKTNCVLIVVSGILLFSYACTKNGVSLKNPPKSATSTEKTLDTTFTTTPITASIVGKWYVNKERVQILTASTGAITDTTYSGTSFNTNFYYQFNGDGTATFTQGTIFFTSSATTVIGSVQTATPLTFTYNVTSSILTVKYKDVIPMSPNTNGGPYPLDIVQLDANNLVLHGINSTINGSEETVMDVYLTRGQ